MLVVNHNLSNMTIVQQLSTYPTIKSNYDIINLKNNQNLLSRVHCLHFYSGFLLSSVDNSKLNAKSID